MEAALQLLSLNGKLIPIDTSYKLKKKAKALKKR